MRAALLIAHSTAALLLVRALPNLSLAPQTRHSLAVIVFTNVFVVVIGVILFRSIERSAEKVLGRPLPLSRRMIIPAPALLGIATCIKAWTSSFRGGVSIREVQFYGWTFL